MTETMYIPKALLDKMTDTELEQAAAKLDLDNKKAILTDYAKAGRVDTAYVKTADGYRTMDYADYILEYGDTRTSFEN